jgi:hypothetical protein
VRCSQPPDQPTLHDLRWANATGLVLEGVDIKTAQTRLGHTDPRLTLGICAQATTEADRHAADRLGDRFLPDGTRIANEASCDARWKPPPKPEAALASGLDLVFL